jgi:hypothetical protein
MSNHEISIWLRAKNGMAAGLASAQGSVKAFGKSLQSATRAALGPIAALIGAYMFLNKVIGMVQSVADRKNKAMRGEDELKAKAATESLSRSYNQLTSAIKLRNDAIKDGQKVFDIELKSTRALIAAQRELTKQQELGGVDPADKAAIDAINLKYAEIEATEKAAQTEEDLREKQKRLLDEAASKRQEAIALGKEEQMQSRKAIELANMAAKYAEQSASNSFKRKFGKAASEEAAAAGKAAQDAADRILEQYRRTREAKEAAANAAVQADKQAAAMSAEISAAATSQAALTLEQQNAAAQKAAQDRVEAEKRAADEIEKIREDIAKAEDARIKELDAQHQAFQKKQLADELAANAEKLAAAKDLAKKKIAEFIEESKVKKDEAKQEERDAKKQAEMEARVARGGKLSGGQAEWLAARQAIKGAQAGVIDLEAQKAQIERNQELLNQTEQLLKLGKIENELKIHNIKLDNMLKFGG